MLAQFSITKSFANRCFTSQPGAFRGRCTFTKRHSLTQIQNETRLAIKKQINMRESWIERWDERYSKYEFAYGEQPNNYLKEQLEN